MNAERYGRWSAPFRKSGVIAVMDNVLTVVVYLAYPLSLWLAWQKSAPTLWRAVCVPAVCLVLVSLARRLINRPRPYERLAIEPLIKKDTKGRSFPSRHAFSVWMIATTAWRLLPPLGAALAVVGMLVCAIRVLGGVHDEWDVLVGALIGVLAGVIGYWIL